MHTLTFSNYGTLPEARLFKKYRNVLVSIQSVLEKYWIKVRQSALEQRILPKRNFGTLRIVWKIASKKSR
jgi:hypothetical protein